jgi:hypothetical protein
MLSLYSDKKLAIDGENKSILDNLFATQDDASFPQINNFVARNSYVEIMQFFSPHIFFNLSCWGMRRINDLMRDIKFEIEKLTPSEYRSQKNENIKEILMKYNAYDSGLSVQGNLEVLDIIAFSLADFYQEYRNRLFFTEDILRKQYEEMEVLERVEAKKNLEKKNMLWKEEGGRTHEKTNFELMAEDMGLFFEPEVDYQKEDKTESEHDLFVLKEFLKDNGIEGKYLNNIKDFSEVQKKIENKKDQNYQSLQTNFGMVIFCVY